MINKEDLFPIGITHKPHALQGEITCSFTNTVFDDTDDVTYFVLEIDHIMVPFFLESYRFKTDTTALVKFEGVNTEKDAKKLADTTIYLPLKYIEMTESEDITLQSLVGFEAIDSEVGTLGLITEVDESTLNTLFVIGENKVVIPAHDEFVEKVDYPNRKIFLRIPKELLEL